MTPGTTPSCLVTRDLVAYLQVRLRALRGFLEGAAVSASRGLPASTMAVIELLKARQRSTL
ncbi:hypothetical protein ACFWF3_08920 [Nocardia sp. NPDC060220]|uniref:hypothetical protein n=1 Tax=Nocardia sp. NPDC060220 TaxID=3347076 RepID=UPI003665C76C